MNPFSKQVTFDGNGNAIFQSASGHLAQLDFPLTANRVYTLPDQSGTVALTDDIGMQSGTAKLVNGTVTISGVNVTANSIIIVTYNTLSAGSGSMTAGSLATPSAGISGGNGGSFVINSYTGTIVGSPSSANINASDQSMVNWAIVSI